MSSQNAAKIYQKVNQAEAQQQREKAKKDPEAFIVLAKARGYSLNVEDLESQLSELSDEQIADIFNPGIGTRRHLFPK